MAKSVLFLCTGNSARSQMAEWLLRTHGEGLFDPIESAGTRPAGVNPLTVVTMERAGIQMEGARSKSVDEFLEQKFDYIITVCDNAREDCPYFPGDAERIHWSFDDPAAATGDEEARLAEFARVAGEIRSRLDELIERERKAQAIPA